MLPLKLSFPFWYYTIFTLDVVEDTGSSLTSNAYFIAILLAIRQCVVLFEKKTTRVRRTESEELSITGEHS